MLVALIGTGGIFITACSVIVVAVLNNRKERGDTASTAVEKTYLEREKTLRERLALRDEQIADHLSDKTDLKERLADAKKTIADQGLLIAQQIDTIAAQGKIIERDRLEKT